MWGRFVFKVYFLRIYREGFWFVFRGDAGGGSGLWGGFKGWVWIGFELVGLG